MKIERIRIAGFGKLIDRSFDFCPGTNVFFGPNESGKSTLQLALLVLLYGYHASPRGARRGENPLLERFSPWTHGIPYRGSLEFCLDDGNHYRVDRDFSKRTTQLWDMTRSAEISSDYPQGLHGYVGFAREQLGLSKDLFCRTAYISQGSTSQLGDGSEIASALVALLSTGTTDTTVERARQSLIAASENIGTPRSSTRPLDEAEQSLTDLLQEQTRVIKAHEAIVEWAKECEETERTREELLLRLDALDLARLKTELIQLCQRIERHARLQEQLAQAAGQRLALASFAHFAADKQSDVQRLMDRVETYRESVDEVEAIVTGEAGERAEAEEERITIQDSLDAQGELPSRRRDLCEEIESAARNWERAEQGLASHDQRRTETHARLREIGAILAKERQVVRLVHACSPSDFAALVAEHRGNRRDAESEERALSEAQAALHQVGLTPEQAQEMVSLREQVTPELERQMRERAETLMRLEERIATRSSVPTVEPASPVRFPVVPLAAGLVMALMAGVLGALMTSVQLGLTLAFALSAVWGAAMMVWWLTRRGGTVSSSALPTVQDLEAEHAALSRAQTQDARASGFETWESARTALNEYSGMTRHLQALEMAGRRLANAREVYESSVRTIDRLLAKAGIDSWTAESLDKLREEMAQTNSRLRDLRQAAQILRQQRNGRAPMARDLDEKRGRLEHLMAELGIQEGTISERVDSYRELEGRWDEQDRSRQRLSLLEERLASYNARARRLDSSRQAAATAAEELASLLTFCGIEVGGGLSLKEACEAFDQHAAARRQHDLHVAQEESLLNQIDSLLSGDSPEDLESRRGELEERREAIKRRRPGLSTASLGAGDVASRDEIEDQCNKLDRRVTQLNERMHGALDGLRSLASVEEDIVHQRRRIQELESYQTSLAIAEGVLAEAADEYRVAFSPRIQESLDQHVGLLTAGRYSKVMVGPEDLAMTVEVPETEELQEPHVLSYGTQEQLYMLLRLSIAEIFTHSGESIPLILDDPFVNYDDARLDRMLDLLEHVSERHQVILFTMETRIRDWVEGLGDGDSASLLLMA